MVRTILIVLVALAASANPVVPQGTAPDLPTKKWANWLTPQEETEIGRLLAAAREPGLPDDARRGRLRALERRIGEIRRTERRLLDDDEPPARRDPLAYWEPLADVDAWSRIAARRSFPPETAVLGKLVSKPFEGFHFRVPASYRPDRPIPLVICLHDSGGDGRAYIDRYWTDEKAPEAIVFAPDWPDDGPVRWSARTRIGLTLGVVGDAILQRFNVDRNKIFLDGAGRGGTEAWRLASYFAPLFAGVIVRDGFPGPDREGHTVRFGNLRHLRTLYFHVNGSVKILPDSKGVVFDPAKEPPLSGFLRPKDPKTPTERKARQALLDLDTELDNIGHHAKGWAITALEPPLEERVSEMAERIASFMARSTRDPYPSPITWHVRDNNARRAYWIRSIDEEYAFDMEQPSFEAYVNREENRIEITCARIRGVEIQLNDRILDLGRRVQISVNDKILFDGLPSRSLARLLRSVQRSGDPYDVFPWGTRVEIDTAQ